MRRANRDAIARARRWRAWRRGLAARLAAVLALTLRELWDTRTRGWSGPRCPSCVVRAATAGLLCGGCLDARHRVLLDALRRLRGHP